MIPQQVQPGPRLSVVIVSYNTREATARAVQSVLDTVTSCVPEVIVVDNGSEDGSADALAEGFPQVRVIAAGENLGFAGGVNRGAQAASGTHLLLLNPDTVALPGSLDALLAFADAHPEHGLYGGRTLRPDGRTDPSSCWGLPSLWSLLSAALLLSTAFKRTRLFDPESLGRWERDSVREVPVITGCLLLLRRDVFESLGGMDESFFLYGEDAEFSARAARAGWRPVIVPDAVIIHAVGGSTPDSGRKMCMVSAGKVTLLRRTWPPALARIGVALLLAGALNRALLERVSRRRRRMWTDVWSRRRDWVAGYPAATRTLFPALDSTERVS